MPRRRSDGPLPAAIDDHGRKKLAHIVYMEQLNPSHGTRFHAPSRDARFILTLILQRLFEVPAQVIRVPLFAARVPAYCSGNILFAF